MNCYIRRILIFGKNGEKRSVSLKKGLNIISGKSNSGKSALLEIVDYCLGSPRSTIPQGKIIEFSIFFAIIIHFENKSVVLGRPAPNLDESNKMYLKFESGENSVNDIELCYFDKITPRPHKEIIQELGKHLGFEINEYSDNSETVIGHASFRNMVSFLFQHQNLIANKHAVFYRFEDFFKAKRIIQEFPGFMGWVGGDYYSLLRQLNDKNDELRAKKRELKQFANNKNELTSRLFVLIDDYYSIVGKQSPKITNFDELLLAAKNLPDFDNNSYLSNDCEDQKNRLKIERDNLFSERKQIENQISILEFASITASDYNKKINNYSNRIGLFPQKDDYSCPLCNQKVDQINNDIQAVRKSRQIISEDLRKIHHYYVDNSEKMEQFKKDRNTIKQKILRINGELELLEKSLETEDNRKFANEDAVEKKQYIQLSIDLLLGKKEPIFFEDNLEILEHEIELLKQEVGKFDKDTKKEKFEKNLSVDMNEIALNLDFEKELAPPNFHFDTENFAFYHLYKGKQLYLSEMGSGANWLSCHLSLFLALHKQFILGKKCSIPSFLFLDQPSQVYFPQGIKMEKITDDPEFKKVGKIFDLIIDYITKIELQCGYAPQIIIADHVRDIPLKKGSFADYRMTEWFKEGEGLI